MGKGTRILGLTGRAHSGKNAVASCLTNCREIAFAAPLKRIAQAANFPVIDERGRHLSGYGDLVELHGDKAKDMGSARATLQDLYVSMRAELGPEVFVEVALREAVRHLPSENVVFTDLRFENEAEAVHALGGFVVRVSRPGDIQVRQHVTERGLPDHLVDYDLFNDGTLSDLAEKVEVMFHELRRKENE